MLFGSCVLIVFAYVGQHSLAGLFLVKFDQLFILLESMCCLSVCLSMAIKIVLQNAIIMVLLCRGNLGINLFVVVLLAGGHGVVVL